MTLQQLNYIMALEQYRSFAKASEACGITQPTLSKMVANLEDELDVKIFERTSKRVMPTDIGLKIIKQASNVVKESNRIQEIIRETKDVINGDMRLAVGPSIATYLLPKFIKWYGEAYPQVNLSIEEIRPENMIEALLSGRIDAGIAVGGNNNADIFEIPLYTEPFWVYLAPTCKLLLSSFTPAELNHENMWIMKEAQCLRESAFSFCKAKNKGKRIYEAGNIDTLIRVVDENGGFTIIPEMHLRFLDEKQIKNVRRLSGDHLSCRRVSMYIRHDYIREKMLNTIITSLQKCVPVHMFEPSLIKYGIRL